MVSRMLKNWLFTEFAGIVVFYEHPTKIIKLKYQKKIGSVS